MKHSCIWLTGVVLLSLLTCCRGGAGDPSPSPAGATASPVAAVSSPASSLACQLVTRAEVEAATTHSFAEGQYSPTSTGGRCTFAQVRSQSSDEADSVIVQPFVGAALFDALWVDKTHEREVPGLGDRAFASPVEVVVLQGNRGLLIVWDQDTGTTTLSGDERRERLIMLAQTAMGRR